MSYKAVSSFDLALDLSNQSGRVVKQGNETSHVFLGLYPGSTYSFTLKASSVKGYGPPAITQATTRISGRVRTRRSTDTHALIYQEEAQKLVRIGTYTQIHSHIRKKHKHLYT